jgi:type VI secretion system protein ImpG
MSLDFARTWDLLRAEARAFSRAFPQLAPRLAEPSDDPDVDRIAEGVAFLAARVESFVDASGASAVVPYAELLAPEVFRPLPCATIVELRPHPDLRQRTLLEPGIECESVPVEGYRCRFRAACRATLVPWYVDEARLEWSSEEGQSLVLMLASTARPLAQRPLPLRRRILSDETVVDAEDDGDAGSPAEALAGPLPLTLFVDADPRVASTVALWLFRHVKSARAEVERKGEPGAFTLASDALRTRPWGLARGEAMLPEEPFEHPGYRLLREHALLPAKFAFVGVTGPELTVDDGARVRLTFTFDVPLPQGVALGEGALRTNCVPMTNAFETFGEPVRPRLEAPVHPLRIAEVPPEHAGVYAITGVEGALAGRAGAIAPFSERGLPGANVLPGVFYSAHTRDGRGRLPPSVALFFSSPEDVGSAAFPDVAYARVIATQTTLPNVLGIGDVNVAARGLPHGTRVRNVVAVTPYRPAPAGRARRDHALAALSVLLGPRPTVASTRTLLQLLNPSVLASRTAARTLAARLASLEQIDCTPTRFGSARGVFVGYDIAVRLTGGGFDSDGEAYAFAAVLAELFAHEAPAGLFVRTTVTMASTGSVFAFAPRSGEEVRGAC